MIDWSVVAEIDEISGHLFACRAAVLADRDLPEPPELLRALEHPINEIIRQGLEVRTRYLPTREAQATPGLIRSLSVAPPPTDDGMIRIVEIGELDRQACGGTHLSNTAQSRPIRLTKIENKGRRNRRVRIELT